MYLRRNGWTAANTFSIQTLAGEIRPTILDESTCRVDLGRARVGEAGEIDGRPYQQITIGNPQRAIHVPDAVELDTLDLEALGPDIEHHELFPRRTNVSFFTDLAPGAIRARIFERGVGETSASGTGACGAAITHVLRGGDSPVEVHLDGGELVVDVDESLHFTLTGWAEPVFAGELSAELLTALERAG